MPTLTLPGVELHYEIHDAGVPLVLVHGSAVDGGTWDSVVPDLSSTYRVVTYDRRGYGQSTARPVRDHRRHGADLVSLLRQVVAEPAHVVGWSSGGNVTLAVAAAHPELFRSVTVVEAPFHGLRHMDRAVLGTLVRLKAQQLRGRKTAALEEFLRFGSALRSGGNAYDLVDADLRAQLLRYPGQVLAEWDPHPFGVMHEHLRLRAVANIPVPLTWLLGGESSLWMAGLHDRVRAARPGMTTVVVPGASHLVHVDQPDAFVAAIRAAAID